MDGSARQQLRTLGVDVDEVPTHVDFAQPAKALEFYFDSVEICGGSGVLSDAMCQQGLIVCTPIDLSKSSHYDITSLKLINGIFQMIAEKRFRSVVVEPVCRTFSPAQHPASRSYSQPWGFCRTDPKTLLGNIIALRCIAILWFAWRWEAPGLLEQPQLSKMAWLSVWLYLPQIGFEEAVINSCALGSIHKKPFRLLGHGLDMEALRVPCFGGHQHVRIEGKFTSASAIYHPKLAEHYDIAKLFKKALDKHDAPAEKKVTELESVVLNDILQSGGWRVEAAWEWSQPGHINVLESRSLIALFRSLVLRGGDVRFAALLDSRVAKGAHAKGRSSAYALRPSLLRGCAYALAGNLYPSLGFAPTKLNTADAPTRDRSLPQPAEKSILDFITGQQATELHSRQFSKGTAGWIRLYILAVMCLCPVDGFCHSEPAYSASGFWIFPCHICVCVCLGLVLGFVAICVIGFSLSLDFPRIVSPISLLGLPVLAPEDK